METTTKIKEAISKTYSWKAELFWPVRKNQDSDFKELDLFQLVDCKTSNLRRKKSNDRYYFHEKYRPSNDGKHTSEF